MATTIITVEGAEELERRLAALAKVNRSRLVLGAIRQGAELIRSQAEANAPKRTGALARSIQIREVTPSFGIAAHVVVETRAGWFRGKQFYGGHQEFGWRVGKRPHRRKSKTWEWARDRKGNLRRSETGSPYRVLRRNKRYTADGRRKIRGKHFVRRAFRQRGQQAADLAAELMWQGIAAEVTRAG